MSQQHRLPVCGVCLLVGLVGCSGSQTGAVDEQLGGSSSGSAGASNGRGGASSGAGGKSQVGTGATTNASGSTNAAGGRNAAAGQTSSGGNPSGGAVTVGGSSAKAGAANVGGATGKGGSAGTASGGTAGKGGAAPGGTAGKGGSALTGGTAGKASTGGASGKGGTSTGGAVSVGGRSTGGASGSATGGSATGGSATGGSATGGSATGGSATGGSAGMSSLPPAGNPNGHCAIPAAAQLEDVSAPTHVVGNGSPASCTGAEFVKQVALGGIITFNCGANPITINLTQTAKIVNNTGPKIVIDGGGKVTLSGQNNVRILYQNTCDPAQVYTTSHCQDQDHPQLTVQNLTFVNGNASAESDGGGAIFASGGRLKIINSRFFNNVCVATGPDVGGGAVRAFAQDSGLPVYVVNSTFGGRNNLGNSGANGGGLSSIGVSWTVINSLLSYNSATGNGGNPAEPGTPGGGSGGAIYNDGNTMTLSLCGTLIENNTVNAYGGAIFFVSNDHSGSINITDSTIRNNPGGSWYPNYPGISNHDDTPITVVNSTISD